MEPEQNAIWRILGLVMLVALIGFTGMALVMFAIQELMNK